MFENRKWHLQIFADGNEGASAPAANETGGMTTQPVTEPAQQQATDVVPSEEKVSFDDLLKDPDYKREFDKRTNRAAYNARKSAQQERAKLTPMFEALGRKYALDVSDPEKIDLDKLSEAVMADDALFEQEAADMGVTVDGLRRIRSAERQMAERKAADEAADRARFFSELEADGQLVKAEYPDFNYEEAMLDPAFGRLVVSLKANGTANPVQAAYKATHFDAIMKAKVAQAEEQARQSISQTIQSGMNRPREAGTAQATAQMKIDPRNLSEEQRIEIRKRIARGEHVSFG